ncbi:cell division protein ZipA C-terminal FtsZ-binding domain-containing protein [Cysteiniphilum sp. 6C5]|uniref:cell division protein ZipA C-terminal FtsZ-binding domain-containing protein n=1 Tax=unclassified Cysteiniphilum TaxID=2610889 RepID=UPI003F833AA6
MTQVQLILLLSIIIVILLLIDAFRRSKRKKYKREMAKLQAIQEKEKAVKKVAKAEKTPHKQNAEAKQSQESATSHDSSTIDVAQKIELGADIKVDPLSDTPITELEESHADYPQLEKGIVSYFISAPRGYVFNGEDLDTLFKHNGLSFNSEDQSFELLTQDKDVLFSIKADAPVKGFDPENFTQKDYTRLLCRCEIADLVQFYEPQVCFDHFTKSIEKINTRLGGTLLNEHRRRFTSHDESAYKRYIKQFETQS